MKYNRTEDSDGSVKLKIACPRCSTCLMQYPDSPEWCSFCAKDASEIREEIRVYNLRPAWSRYLDKLSEDDLRKMLEIAVERLIKCQEMNFHEADPEEDWEECLYWPGSGENILK